MPPLDWQSVYSSHIDGIAYDVGTQELHVKYQTGKTAIYQDVPPDKAGQVATAPSIGTALHDLVRGQHQHRYAE